MMIHVELAEISRSTQCLSLPLFLFLYVIGFKRMRFINVTSAFFANAVNIILMRQTREDIDSISRAEMNCTCANDISGDLFRRVNAICQDFALIGFNVADVLYC